MNDGPVLRVRAVVVDDDRLLMVRRGQGAAAGVWALPGGPVRTRELLAETVVRVLHEQTGVEGVCGPMIATSEHVEEDRRHEVVLAHGVTLLESSEPRAGDDVAEARWVPLGAVTGLRLVPGLAELLHDSGIIATIT